MTSSHPKTERAVLPWRRDASDEWRDTAPFCPRCGETLGINDDFEVGLSICAECRALRERPGGRRVAS